MKKLNKNDYIALENILLVPNMNKTDLSKILKISPPAVFKIIKKLNDRNLLSDQTTLMASRGGRPRNTISINKHYKKIVGIFLSDKNISTTISYLNGEIIETRLRKRTNVLLQANIIKLMFDELEYIIDKYNNNEISGIGLSLPGLIDSENGIIKYSSLFKKENLKIAEYIQDTFKIPCIIENNIRSVLKAEKILGSLVKTKNAFVVYYNDIIGSALLINDFIYPGVNFAAGQFNDTVSNTNISLGEYCSFKHMLERLKLKNDLENISIEKFIEFANSDIEEYKNIVFDIGEKIGLALSNVIKLLDIGTVVLTGSQFENNELLINSIIESAKKNIPKKMMDNTKIIKSNFGNNIEVYGSISLVISNLFSGRKLIK